jgi:hypothetical protein
MGQAQRRRSEGAYTAGSAPWCSCSTWQCGPFRAAQVGSLAARKTGTRSRPSPVGSAQNSKIEVLESEERIREDSHHSRREVAHSSLVHLFICANELHRLGDEDQPRHVGSIELHFYLLLHKNWRKGVFTGFRAASKRLAILIIVNHNRTTQFAL